MGLQMLLHRNSWQPQTGESERMLAYLIVIVVDKKLNFPISLYSDHLAKRN